MISEHGICTRGRICYLIGKYQCLLDDDRISDQERKTYAGILEDLRHLLETAMQEGLQS